MKKTIVTRKSTDSCHDIRCLEKEALLLERLNSGTHRDPIHNESGLNFFNGKCLESEGEYEQ
eukprot:scaffold21821_cov74-Skeletonema_menzelii.AAC.1